MPETPVTLNHVIIRVENERELLDKTQAHAVHHMVAQLLFTGI